LALSPVPAFFDPIHFFQSWIKKMDTTHHGLLDLREYHRALIAPIAVGPVLMPSSLIVPDGGMSMRPVEGVRPLIKFQFGFTEEDDEDLSPAAAVMLDFHRSGGDKGRSAGGLPERTQSIWGTKRSTVLREMFPLTVFRSKRRDLPNQVRAQLSRVQIADWQIEQAVCNLVMSRALGADGKHYNGIAPNALVDRIANAASGYVELANGKDDLAEFSPADVARQVWLDADYLVVTIGERARDGSLSARQSILRRRGYLEKH
jgi:hypothetical protein